MEYVNIPLWSIVLFVIEKVRVIIASKDAKRTFGNYHDFFFAEKKKHPVSIETHQMEELVESNTDFQALQYGKRTGRGG